MHRAADRLRWSGHKFEGLQDSDFGPDSSLWQFKFARSQKFLVRIPTSDLWGGLVVVIVTGRWSAPDSAAELLIEVSLYWA